MIYAVKKIFFILLIVTLMLSSAIFVSRVFSYNDTVSHPFFTANIADVYNDNFEEKLSLKEINWLMMGSFEEDTPPRWMNHFYEPNTNKGIWGFKTSRDWAQSSGSQSISIGGDQTWQKAIDSYVSGDDEKAFRALGHVLHLLEDATVPAHTRLDAHILGDPYEGWVEKSISANIHFNVSPATTGNLYDAFYQLAIYSNRYFLSKDTIDSKNLSDTKIFEKNNAKCIEGSDDMNNKFCLVLVEQSFFSKNYYIDDPLVNSDYFNLLGSKAVSYGAGVIDLFFREAGKKKQEQEQQSWWNKIKGWISNSKSSLLSLVNDNNQQSNNSTASGDITIDQNALDELINPQNSQADNTQNNEISQPENDSGIVSVQPEFVLQIADDQSQASGSDSVEVGDPGQNDPAQNNDDGQQIVSQNFPPTQLPQDIGQQDQGSDGQTSGDQEQDGNSTNNQSAVGSRSPDSASGIDNIFPETYATSTLFAINSTTATTTAIFEFSSDDSEATFECSLDGMALTPCVSPMRYENLSDGAREFQVVAIDQENNRDETPVIINWTVDQAEPVISDIAVDNITRTSARISFLTDESAYGKIEYGTTTLYSFETEWETTTSTSHSIILPDLTAGETYHFRALAKDEAGNESASVDNMFITSVNADHVVISEIAAAGPNGSKDEFIEIYNPTNANVDIKNWSIQYASATATTTSAWSNKYFDVGGEASSDFPDFILQPGQFFLVASATIADGYSYGVPPDLSAIALSNKNPISLNLADTGGKVKLLNADDEIIDSVGWGASTVGAEGNPVDIVGLVWGSLERKANASSSSESLAIGADKWQGNGYDSDDNSNDFVLQASPTPQNSQSLSEPRDSLPSLASDAPWPMFQQNENRQGYSDFGPATSTVQILTNNAAVTFSSPPVIGQNQIYVGANNGIYAFSLNGSQIWFYSTGVQVGTISIGSGGIVYAGARNDVYAFSEGGVLKWKVSSISESTPINIDKNGIIYAASNGKVYALFPDGKIKWIFDISQPLVDRIFSGSSGSGTISIDNGRERIYINIDNYLYALNFDGSLVWDFKDNDSSFASHFLRAPVIDNNGIIYFGFKLAFPGGGFYALNPDRTVRWLTEGEGYCTNSSPPPALGPDNNVYFVATKYSSKATTRLFAFNQETGEINWSVLTGDSNSSSPIVAGDKLIITAGAHVKAFDFAGNLLWDEYVGDGSILNSGFGAVDSNGNLYLAVNGRIYKIGN
jgi:hypothetical protein